MKDSQLASARFQGGNCKGNNAHRLPVSGQLARQADAAAVLHPPRAAVDSPPRHALHPEEHALVLALQLLHALRGGHSGGKRSGTAEPSLVQNNGTIVDGSSFCARLSEQMTE